LTPRAIAVALAGAAWLWGGRAAAQPSLWDAARDPNAPAAYHALVQAETYLARAEEEVPYSAAWRAGLQAATAILAKQREARDPRVPILLAETVSRLGTGWERDVRDLLTRTLAADPPLDPSLAAQALYQLALAAARLDDRQFERDAYGRALELVHDADQRANLFYNRADAEVGLGLLDAALVDYRRAIPLARDPALQALAYYGLGIALERRGDLPSAFGAVRLARSLQGAGAALSVLDHPDVFFVPEYDLYYYKALDEMAAAQTQADPTARRVELLGAAAYWQRYLMEAEPAGHRWAANARRHLARCEREVERLDRPTRSVERLRRAR